MTNFDPSALVVVLLGSLLVQNVDAFAGLKRPTSIKGFNSLYMVCWTLNFDFCCVSFVHFVPAGGRESYPKIPGLESFEEFRFTQFFGIEILTVVEGYGIFGRG